MYKCYTNVLCLLGWTTVVDCLSGHTLMTTAMYVSFCCILVVRNHALVGLIASAAELVLAAEVYVDAKGVCK